VGKRLRALAIVMATTALIVGYLWWPAPADPPLPADWSAIVGVLADNREFSEPFDVARAADGTLYVTDGAAGHRIRGITPSGVVLTLAGGHEGFSDGQGPGARFSTPSGIAIDATGTLYVADTGNDAVRRVSPAGDVSTLARGLGGPLDVAIDRSGRLLVADTYNDRIAVIDSTGVVNTLNVAAILDTPSSVAVAANGTIYIADTGNNVVRSVAADGVLTTIDAVDVGGWQRPIGVAVDRRGHVYVADESARIFEVRLDGTTRIVAGSSPGYRNGRGSDAQFRQPAGLAVVEPGRLVVADSGNALVRSVTAREIAELSPPPFPGIAPRFDVTAFESRPLLWPLAPLHGPFEIAGTIGEARGEDAGRFHAGIDVRADQGSDVLAVRDGIVKAPLSTGSFGTLNEWIRVGDVSYVHLRVGRDRRGTIFDSRFVGSYDERGDLTRVRVKRGARFSTGDLVGTVNAFNHVHLNVGWGGEEYNPLLFNLVQFEDTVRPTIPRNGVRLFSVDGTPLVARERGRLIVSGLVQVVVEAWDQVNGNRPNRRLGVYSLGYQVLNPDGTPATGFEQPIETIRFDQLQMSADATRHVFAPGSGIPFYGQRRTRFLYIVTNTFRDGVAAQGYWDTRQLVPGNYTLRVRVADINGNEAIVNRDLPVTVTGLAPAAGA
jgi:sugar lactone lactonase YvrE